MPKQPTHLFSIYPSQDTSHHLQARSCLYGDGLFETIAVKAGQVQHWADHYARLAEGLARLSYPEIAEVELYAHLQQGIAETASPKGNHVIRLSISRMGGLGQRGYRIPTAAQLLIDLHILPYPQHRWHGQAIVARWCHTRWAKQPLLAGIKHLNRLEQVIARSEWDDTGIAEGLVCDTEGNVISGTMSGLVWRMGKQIFAPDLSHTGIASTSRKRLLNQAQALGYDVQIGRFMPQAVMQADEVLVMNAIQGIAYLSHLDDHAFSPPSLITELLQQD